MVAASFHLPRIARPAALSHSGTTYGTRHNWTKTTRRGTLTAVLGRLSTTSRGHPLDEPDPTRREVCPMPGLAPSAERATHERQGSVAELPARCEASASAWPLRDPTRPGDPASTAPRRGRSIRWGAAPRTPRKMAASRSAAPDSMMRRPAARRRHTTTPATRIWVSGVSPVLGRLSGAGRRSAALPSLRCPETPTRGSRRKRMARLGGS